MQIPWKKYASLVACLILICLLMVIFSSNVGNKLLNHPVYREIQKREIDASALFYTESDIPLKSSRKLQNKIK